MSLLQRLPPSTAQKLPREPIQFLPAPEPKAGTCENVNPRPRGRAWMETRKRIAQRDGGRCCDCNRVWLAERDEVDHDTPREAGGSDEDGNLRLRCFECHAEKSRCERLGIPYIPKGRAVP